MHSHPEKYTKPANLSYKIMQLRSGTVLSSPATSRRANTNTRDPDYVVSKVEVAKFKVREQVRERQRKIAEQIGEMISANPTEAAGLLGRWVRVEE